MGRTREGTLREKAALEATAIVERAAATAMILRAQAEATAYLRQAQEPAPPSQATAVPPQVRTPTASPTGSVTASPTAPAAIAEVTAVDTPEPSAGKEGGQAPAAENADEVELLGVGFGAEGNLIVVNYRASPAVAQEFWPGVLSVVDEATGTVYNEVAVMPVIGPLIARPKEPGQAGYVMFANPPPGLRSGALVTVVLSHFRQEHVVVEGGAQP
jgi:hypothetical protein